MAYRQTDHPADNVRIHPDQMKALNSKLDALNSKLDALLERPGSDAPPPNPPADSHVKTTPAVHAAAKSQAGRHDK